VGGQRRIEQMEYLHVQRIQPLPAGRPQPAEKNHQGQDMADHQAGPVPAGLQQIV